MLKYGSTARLGNGFSGGGADHRRASSFSSTPEQSWTPQTSRGIPRSTMRARGATLR